MADGKEDVSGGFVGVAGAKGAVLACTSRLLAFVEIDQMVADHGMDLDLA